jgi:hypothetical protein
LLFIKKEREVLAVGSICSSCGDGGNLKSLVSQDNGMKIIESKIAELLNSDALPNSKQFLNLANEES